MSESEKAQYNVNFFEYPFWRWKFLYKPVAACIYLVTARQL